MSVWQINQSGMKFKDKKIKTKQAEQKCSAFFIHRKEGEAMDKIILAALSLAAVVVKEIFEDR